MTSYILLKMLMAKLLFKASSLHRLSGVGLWGFTFNKSPPQASPGAWGLGPELRRVTDRGLIKVIAILENDTPGLKEKH